MKVEKDAYTALENAHALVVCTEWDEFKVRCLPPCAIVSGILIPAIKLKMHHIYLTA